MENQHLSDDAKNISLVESYQLLDIPEEKTFDDIAELASEICETPIALVSLVDHDRHWFKSKIGIDIKEVPQSMSFCTHAIQEPEEIFLVTNAASDSRFANNPFVTGESQIKFYAGAPLVAKDGKVLGMLCVLDHKPRELSEKQKLSLRVLARQIVTHLEMQEMIQQMQKSERRRKKVEIELRESETRFKAFMDNSPATAYMKDEHGNYVYVNRPLELYFDAKEGELLGKNDFYLMPSHIAQKVQKNDARVLSEMQTTEILEETENESGLKSYWLSLKFPFADTNGKKFLGGVSFNITARKIAEEKLNESEQRYRNLFEMSPGFISIHDLSGRIISVNEATATALGCKTSEITGKKIKDFLSFGSRAYFDEYIWQVRERSQDEGIMQVMTKSGEKRTWQYRSRVYREINGENQIIAYAQDITELENIQKKLHELTLKDELTGLYNRRGFFTLAEQALRYARRKNKNCLVIYADLDNLKTVNDKFGHAAGSQMLIDTANIFEKFFRDSDIIARLGGDEFVILAQDTSSSEDKIIRERLENKIEEFNRTYANPFAISVSFGIASFDPKSTETIENLISEADRLMYAQKKKKKELSQNR